MNYFDKARHRAQRRKSPWNLLLIPAVLIPLAAIYVVSLIAVESLRTQIHPGETLRNASGFGAILVTVSPFFGAIPLGMILGNLFVWLIPPARRVLDAEAIPYPETTFWNAQKTLVKFTFAIVPLSVALTILGIQMPWVALK